MPRRRNTVDQLLHKFSGKEKNVIIAVHVGSDGNLVQRKILFSKRKCGLVDRNHRVLKKNAGKFFKFTRDISDDDLVFVAMTGCDRGRKSIKRVYDVLGLRTPPIRANRGSILSVHKGRKPVNFVHEDSARSLVGQIKSTDDVLLYYDFTLSPNAVLKVDAESNSTESKNRIKILHNDTNWRAGDHVIVTSSSFDWRESEQSEIVERSDNELILKEPLKNHHSTMVKNRVDTRAEVLLLTRRILIRGLMSPDCPAANQNCGNCSRDQQPISGVCDGYNYDTFGGHIMVKKSFSRAVIQGVELYNMGQQTQLGSYPVHFHMAGDVSGRAEVRFNSVHRSHSRCVTIHGTHNLIVTDNVCYDHLGHGYYLEDGGELNNTLTGNVGLGTRPSNLTLSDDEPGTFWLTSPRVNVRDNVAAGGDGVGFWFIFPNQPMGESGNLSDPVYRWGEAKRTPITSFINNVAHSNAKTGLFVGNSFSNDTDTTACTSQYTPRTDPRDQHSPPQPTYLSRYTGYKNGRHNAWIVGGAVILDQASLADSPVQVFYNERGEGVPGLERSVLVGKLQDDDKTGTKNRNRMKPVRGLTFNGRLRVDGVWFDSFPGRWSGAVSFLTNVLRTGSSFHNVSWGPSFSKRKNWENRVYFKSRNRGRTALVDDRSGELSGYRDSVITNLRWNSDRQLGCRHKHRWNMAVCDSRTQMAMLFWKFRNGFTISRQQVSTRSLTSSEVVTHTGGGKEGSYVILQNGSYALDYWKGTLRASLRYTMKAFLLEVSNLRAGNHVTFALCLSKQNVSVQVSNNVVMVGSRGELDNMYDDAAYQDNELGILFIRFYAKKNRFLTRKVTVNLFFPREGFEFYADCRNETVKILDEVTQIHRVGRRRKRHVALNYHSSPPLDYGAGSSIVQ